MNQQKPPKPIAPENELICDFCGYTRKMSEPAKRCWCNHPWDLLYYFGLIVAFVASMFASKHYQQILNWFDNLFS